MSLEKVNIGVIGRQQPFSTVKQAFVAEALGYAAVVSSEKDKYIDLKKILPPDLKCIWKNPLSWSGLDK